MNPRSFKVGRTIDTVSLMLVSSTSRALEHASEGSADNSQVEHEPLVAQIIKLVLELLDGITFTACIAVLHLRPTGQPGLGQMSEVVEGQFGRELLHVTGLLRTRANNRKLSSDNVDHLGNFIEMGTAEKVSERRDAWIILGCPLVRQRAIARPHGSKLQDGNRNPPSPTRTWR